MELAERKGAVGVLLYSDPRDFAQKGRNDIYPDSWWMPGMAVQSGTVYLDNGDPLTRFYPAIGNNTNVRGSKTKKILIITEWMTHRERVPHSGTGC